MVDMLFLVVYSPQNAIIAAVWRRVSGTCVADTAFCGGKVFTFQDATAAKGPKCRKSFKVRKKWLESSQDAPPPLTPRRGLDYRGRVPDASP